MTKRLCAVQHAEGEGLGSLQSWFVGHHYAIDRIFMHRNDPLPDPNLYDWVVVMGGPMSTYQEAEYPWLIEEKAWLREVISLQDTKLLGICLGAQLMASAAGAAVQPNTTQEIGWFPITRTNTSAEWLPPKGHFLSWHGDCFELPEGGTGFARSQITPNQGFHLSKNKWALQFHIEAEPGTARAFMGAGDGTLPEGEWVQSFAEISALDYLAESAAVARGLLNFMRNA